MKPKCVTIRMKAIEQYFHVVLFIMLYKVVLYFKCVDETLVSDHSNKRYGVLLSSGIAVNYAVQLLLAYSKFCIVNLDSLLYICTINNYH